MRRHDREITDTAQIASILDQARYLHLGMHDGEFPYVVPLHYGFIWPEEGNLRFYVHCASEGHKLDCLAQNSAVFVQIDCGERLVEGSIPCEYGAEYQCFMGRGYATVVTDAAEKIEGLKAIMGTQTGTEHEITEAMATGVTVLRIDIESYSAKARRA